MEADTRLSDPAPLWPAGHRRNATASHEFLSATAAHVRREDRNDTNGAHNAALQIKKRRLDSDPPQGGFFFRSVRCASPPGPLGLAAIDIDTALRGCVAEKEP
jgi:hypothetical protein